MRRLTNERGIALAVAIFALVVVGGLIAGSFFVAMLEQRVGRNTLKQQAAFNVAETATQDALLNWSTGGYNNMSIGGSVVTNGTAPDGSWYRRSVKKLGDMMFLVSAEGFNPDSSSRSRVGYLLRLRPLAFNINAALKTQGTLKVGGSSFISGVDSMPVGWTGCPALQPTLPGIRMPDPTQIQTSSCSPSGSPPNYPCIVGSPRDVVQDTTINTNTLSKVGDIPFDSLQYYASLIIPGGNWDASPNPLVGGPCVTSDLHNWGDPVNPLGPCGSYFPIIWSQGDLRLNAQGIGQGVLIVNGNLTVTGGFSFYGPVLVKGTLSTSGTGGHFNGGVIAANTDLCVSNSCETTVMGNALVNYSSCALIKAMKASASASTLKQRSWVTLY